MRPLLTSLAGGAGLILAALLLYHRLWIVPAMQVGIIDLTQVYREQEETFTQQITLARTEAERNEALEQVSSFAQRLTLALEQLPRDCDCLVLIKGAATAPPSRVRDLTPELQRRVAQP